MGIFSRIYRSNLSIYLQNYVKNGLNFKTTNRNFFNTVHNLITFSMGFTNKNGGGALWAPPLKTKVCKPPIITKVKQRTSSFAYDYHMPKKIVSVTCYKNGQAFFDIHHEWCNSLSPMGGWQRGQIINSAQGSGSSYSDKRESDSQPFMYNRW